MNLKRPIPMPCKECRRTYCKLSRHRALGLKKGITISFTKDNRVKFYTLFRDCLKLLTYLPGSHQLLQFHRVLFASRGLIEVLI